MGERKDRHLGWHVSRQQGRLWILQVCGLAMAHVLLITPIPCPAALEFTFDP